MSFMGFSKGNDISQCAVASPLPGQRGGYGFMKTLDQLRFALVSTSIVMLSFTAVCGMFFGINKLFESGVRPDDIEKINRYKHLSEVFTVMMITGAAVLAFCVLLAIVFFVSRRLYDKKSRSPNLNNPSSKFGNLSSQDFPLRPTNGRQIENT